MDEDISLEQIEQIEKEVTQELYEESVRTGSKFGIDLSEKGE